MTDPFCGGVEFFAVASSPFRVDAESVARGPREYVQVHMEYFLERGLAVGEEHIHSLARQAGTAQRPRQPVCHPENVRPEILVEGLQEVHVCPGDHQQVTLGHRLDVHERGNPLIVVDRAGLRAARHDVAEQARTPCGHLRHVGIVAQTALQLHPTFGHRTPPARARFAATRMAPLGVPGDWWLEPEVWVEVLHLETLRHDHAMTSADEYQGLNVQARLVAGLLTVEAWLRVHGLADAAVADLLEHMWQWPMVTPDSFRAWYDFHSEELQAAEAGEPLPPRAALACQQRGAPAADLAAMLADVVNIVYDSLFGALDLTCPWPSYATLRMSPPVRASASRPRGASPASGHRTSTGGDSLSPPHRSPTGAGSHNGRPILRSAARSPTPSRVSHRVK